MAMITYNLSEHKYECQTNEQSSNEMLHLNTQQFSHTGQRGVDVESSLNPHQLVHTCERKCSCETCLKKFSTNSDVSRYQRVHKGERNYICAICEQKFSRKSHVSEHLLIHAGERNYICEKCSKRFNQKSCLNRQLLIHSGDRNYICETCNKKCNVQSHLITHRLICEKRNKSSTQVLDLYRQETSNNSEHQIHTDECPSVCERFSNRSDLQKYNMIPCCTQRNEQIVEEDVNSIQCKKYVWSDCDLICTLHWSILNS